MPADVLPLDAFLRSVDITTQVSLIPEASPCRDPACHEACGAPTEVVLHVTRDRDDVVLHLSGHEPPLLIERSEASPRDFATLATAVTPEHVDAAAVRDGRLMFYRVP